VTWGTRTVVLSIKGVALSPPVRSESTFGCIRFPLLTDLMLQVIQQQLDPFELDEWLSTVSLRKRLISTVLHIRCLPVVVRPSLNRLCLTVSPTRFIGDIPQTPIFPFPFLRIDLGLKFDICCSFKSLVDELGGSAQAGCYHMPYL
jgi:hypothetical protein